MGLGGLLQEILFDSLNCRNFPLWAISQRTQRYISVPPPTHFHQGIFWARKKENENDGEEEAIYFHSSSPSLSRV